MNKRRIVFEVAVDEVVLVGAVMAAVFNGLSQAQHRGEVTGEVRVTLTGAAVVSEGVLPRIAKEEV